MFGSAPQQTPLPIVGRASVTFFSTTSSGRFLFTDISDDGYLYVDDLNHFSMSFTMPDDCPVSESECSSVQLNIWTYYGPNMQGLTACDYDADTGEFTVPVHTGGLERTQTITTGIYFVTSDTYSDVYPRVKAKYGPSRVDLTNPPVYELHLTQRPSLLTLTCTAVEVNPNPTYSWSGSQCAGITQSTCSFVPTPQFDGDVISCTAVNPISNVTKTSEERTLRIYYPTKLKESDDNPFHLKLIVPLLLGVIGLVIVVGTVLGVLIKRRGGSSSDILMQSRRLGGLTLVESLTNGERFLTPSGQSAYSMIEETDTRSPPTVTATEDIYNEIEDDDVSSSGGSSSDISMQSRRLGGLTLVESLANGERFLTPSGQSAYWMIEETDNRSPPTVTATADIYNEIEDDDVSPGATSSVSGTSSPQLPERPRPCFRRTPAAEARPQLPSLISRPHSSLAP